MTDATMGYTADIAPELVERLEVVPISELTPHPDNAREHRIEVIAAGLKAHGQRKPVIVDSTNTIVAGHGVTEAASLLGWDSIAILRQQWDDDDKELAYLLSDNKSSDVSGYRRDKLLAGLERLASGPTMMDSLFGIDELEDLREEARPIAEMPDQGGGSDQEARPSGEEKKEASADKGGKKQHEIPLLMDDDGYMQFMDWVEALQKEWDLTGKANTIVAAVKYAVEHVGQHKEPEGEQPEPAPITNISPLRQSAGDTDADTDPDFPV